MTAAGLQGEEKNQECRSHKRQREPTLTIYDTPKYEEVAFYSCGLSPKYPLASVRTKYPTIG